MSFFSPRTKETIQKEIDALKNKPINENPGWLDFGTIKQADKDTQLKKLTDELNSLPPTPESTPSTPSTPPQQGGRRRRTQKGKKSKKNKSRKSKR